MPALEDIQPRSFVELHWENDDMVRVVLPNNAEMVLTIEGAIQACRAYKDQIRFKGQFDQLLQRLGRWVREHRAALHKAFVTTRDRGLLFLAVTKGKEYNGDLESQLTELDLEIANDVDSSLIHLDVLAIPFCSDSAIRAFLSRATVEYRMDG